MKGSNKPTHRPYFPPNVAASRREQPYICRLAPGEFGFELEWLPLESTGPYNLCYGIRGSEDYEIFPLLDSVARVRGLEPDTEYEVLTVDGVLTVNPKLMDIDVTKLWDDKSDEAGLRPDSVKLQLTADGVAYGDAVTVDASGEWKHSWENVPVYTGAALIEYGVVELDVPESYSSLVKGSAADGFTVTNTYPAKYNVTYKYTGTVPAGAPMPPEGKAYGSGETVTVAAAPELEGYTFSGWSMEGSFTMPAEHVEITGGWRINKYGYTVNYYKDSIGDGNLLKSETGEADFGSDIPYENGAYVPAG